MDLEGVHSITNDTHEILTKTYYDDRFYQSAEVVFEHVSLYTRSEPDKITNITKDEFLDFLRFWAGKRVTILD